MKPLSVVEWISPPTTTPWYSVQRGNDSILAIVICYDICEHLYLGPGKLLEVISLLLLELVVFEINTGELPRDEHGIFCLTVGSTSQPSFFRKATRSSVLVTLLLLKYSVHSAASAENYDQRDEQCGNGEDDSYGGFAAKLNCHEEHLHPSQEKLIPKMGRVCRIFRGKFMSLISSG
jgi:hypothetical protein